jgi:hypothetical protein
MDLGHKVAVMVRLIGAAVNDGDRPQERLAGRNNKSWLSARSPHHARGGSTKQFVAATL